MKKFISVLLAVTMLFSVFAISASAEEATSGYYTYTVDENGNATITDVDYSISGDITIPSNLDGYPVTAIGSGAFSYSSQLTSVDLCDGIEVIGSGAFYDCGLLGELSIPASVKEIGDRAFTYCYFEDITVDPANEYYTSDEAGVLYNKGKTEIIQSSQLKNITSYTMPDTVVTVKQYAFYRHEFLESLCLGEYAQIIEVAAFGGCEKLKEITMNSRLSSLGEGAFGATAIESIALPDSLVYLGQTVFAYCSELRNVQFGRNTKNIGNGAFDGCVSLNNVELPESVFVIGGASFRNCDSLTEVTIPEGVIEIGVNAFTDCDNLEMVYVPSSVETIEEGAFSACTKLTQIIASEANQEYSSDENGCLLSKDKTILIQYPANKTNSEFTIPNNIIEIYERAFYGCETIKSVTIPASVKKIGDYSFGYCTNLNEITLSDEVRNIGSMVFYDTAYYNDEANWSSDGILYVGNHAVDSDFEIISATIKDGTKTIAHGAFYGSNYLTGVTIPDSVAVINDSAFASCRKLTNVIIGNGVKYIGSEAFYGSVITEISIPDSVSEIGNKAFYNCSELATVKIGSGVKKMGEDIFGGCIAIIGFAVDENNNSYLSDEVGVLFNKEKNILIKYPAGSTNASYSVPNGVERIEAQAFENAESLTDISLPLGITSIGGSAFGGTGYLSDSSNWEWDDQSNYVSMYIDSYLVAIELASYDLINFVIKDGTTLVADGLLNGVSLYSQSIVVPATLESGLDRIALGLSFSLEKIIVDNNNKVYSSDENGVLYNKDRTKLIAYPSGSKAVDYTVTDGVKTIGEYAFLLNSAIESIILPDSVDKIETCAFAACTELKKVHIPASVTSIDEDIFMTISGEAGECTICSNSADCFAGEYADNNGINFELCVGHGLSEPDEPDTPDEPDIPDEPDTPDVPDEPNVPAVVPEIIPTPTESTISYGDSIILHADVSKIPEGGYVEWTASNGNFSYSASDDGLTCRISPKSSGTTEFTATVYDANGNAVSTDTQQMTSRAGFFNKLIAFFKKLFGLTKVIPQVLKIFK